MFRIVRRVHFAAVRIVVVAIRESLIAFFYLAIACFTGCLGVLTTTRDGTASTIRHGPGIRFTPIVHATGQIAIAIAITGLAGGNTQPFFARACPDIVVGTRFLASATVVDRRRDVGLTTIAMVPIAVAPPGFALLNLASVLIPNLFASPALHIGPVAAVPACTTVRHRGEIRITGIVATAISPSRGAIVHFARTRHARSRAVWHGAGNTTSTAIVEGSKVCLTAILGVIVAIPPPVETGNDLAGSFFTRRSFGIGWAACDATGLFVHAAVFQRPNIRLASCRRVPIATPVSIVARLDGALVVQALGGSVLAGIAGSTRVSPATVIRVIGVDTLTVRGWWRLAILVSEFTTNTDLVRPFTRLLDRDVFLPFFFFPIPFDIRGDIGFHTGIGDIFASREVIQRLC